MSNQPWGRPDPDQQYGSGGGPGTGDGTFYPYTQPQDQSGSDFYPYTQPSAAPGQYGPYEPYGMAPYGPGPYAGYPGPGQSRPRPAVGFGQAVRLYFKNYAVFSGRASRSEYWYAFLFNALIGVVFGVVLGVMGGAAMFAMLDDYNYTMDPALEAGLIVISVAYGVYALATLVPNLAIGSRRLHDSGKPGLLMLLYLAAFVPYVGWVASIVLIVFMAQAPDPTAWQRYDNGTLPAEN